MKTRRQRIIDTIDTSVGKLLYYDRKEDEDLPRGAIDEAIKNNEITVDEMVEEYRKRLVLLNGPTSQEKLQEKSH